MICGKYHKWLHCQVAPRHPCAPGVSEWTEHCYKVPQQRLKLEGMGRQWNPALISFHSPQTASQEAETPTQNLFLHQQRGKPKTPEAQCSYQPASWSYQGTDPQSLSQLPKQYVQILILCTTTHNWTFKATLGHGFFFSYLYNGL